MTGYLCFSLIDMIRELGEVRVKTELSSFSCPLNKDVEYFLKNKSIEFARQSLAQTSLIYTSYKNENVLIGYYTLASKEFTVKKKDISQTLYKKLKKFGNVDATNKILTIPSPLIAQLGKNFRNGYNTLITGDELLKIACDKIRDIQKHIGGKVVYLECEDKPRLVKFYESNGFCNFGKRNLEKSERDKMSGQYLIQLLRYLEPK